MGICGGSVPGRHECFATRARSYAGDNRLVARSSLNGSGLSAPRCCIATTWGCSSVLRLACSARKVARDVSLERRKANTSCTPVTGMLTVHVLLELIVGLMRIWHHAAAKARCSSMLHACLVSLVRIHPA